MMITDSFYYLNKDILMPIDRDRREYYKNYRQNMSKRQKVNDTAIVNNDSERSDVNNDLNSTFEKFIKEQMRKNKGDKAVVGQLVSVKVNLNQPIFVYLFLNNPLFFDSLSSLSLMICENKLKPISLTAVQTFKK
jgi:hypothetical protein